MNYLAIVIAAVSSFLIGGLWYSKALFGAAWNRENGSPPPPGHPGKVFGISFVLSLVAAAAFAALLGPAPALDTSLTQGALVGFGIVAASFGINYQFAQRSFELWLIDGGHHLVQFLVFGLILGLWH